MRQQFIRVIGLIPLVCLLLLEPVSVLGQGGNGNGNGNGRGNGKANGKEKENGNVNGNGNSNGNGNAEDRGRPAKISWTGCRLTMSDFDETGENGDVQLTTELSFESDEGVESADLWVSRSLWGVFEFNPDSFGEGDIAAETSVAIEVTLDTTPCEEGRTIGGTIHLRSGGRTLAKPCGVSLKRDACEELDDGLDPPLGDLDEDGDDEDDDSPPITWQVGEEGEEEELEELTGEHFDENGEAAVKFCSEKILDAVNVSLTPSLFDCFTLVDPPEGGFPLRVEAGQCVDLTFMLTMSAEEFTSDCGGTVHVVNAANDGIPSKTFAEPLSVNLFGDDEQEEVVPSAVVSAASFEQQSIAAGQVVSIFGLGLGPEQLQVSNVNEDGGIDENLAGTLVLFDGIPAPLLSTYRGQINAIVPSSVRGSDVELRVIHFGKQSTPFPVPLGPAAPALFTLDGTGLGQAAAINLDGTVNTPSNAARRGTVIQLFGTGGGPTEPALGDGEIVGENPPRLVSPVQVLIGGEEGDLLFAGGAPGLVNGVAQFNVRIPWGINPGPREVTVIVDGVSSGGDVTIAVK